MGYVNVQNRDIVERAQEDTSSYFVMFSRLRSWFSLNCLKIVAQWSCGE